ncbi:MAG TPA: hypothetical protein VEJ84_22065 [Acidimicrobiales bacterium]|nr:hypothetical protein [Acidimicrobiales bacterium]
MSNRRAGPDNERVDAVLAGPNETALRVSIASGAVEVSLAPVGGPWALRRAHEAPEGWATGANTRPALLWSLETDANERASWAAAVGRSETLVHAICLMVRAGSEWVEVTESLSSSDAQSGSGAGTGAQLLLPIEWLQSRWHFSPGSRVSEVFTPSLIPEDGDLIGQHMLRSPVLVAESAEAGVALAVDVDVLRKARLPAALSLLQGADGVDLVVGLRPQKKRDHVFHTEFREPSGTEVGAIWHRYHLGLFPTPGPGASLAAARRKIWSVAQGDRAARPLDQAAEDYARQVYPRVIDLLWRETNLDGRRAGAITTNRSYRGDVWFSSWFNPLRSSYGLYHYGATIGRDEWVEMARATRALVLSAPLTRGLLPTVFVFGEDRWVESHHQGGGPGIFHLMDMSWTMYQLLRWHRDLEPDQASIDLAGKYADALVALQRADGGFPAYVDKEGRPVTSVDRGALVQDLQGRGGDPYVLDMTTSRWSEARFVASAEDSASLLFLATLASQLPPGHPAQARILEAARRSAGYLAEHVLPEAKWTDFEVYFSCSPKSLDFYDHRSGQWPQNTLCMQHAAAGFLSLYEVTGKGDYLVLAGRVMDRLSLYQQVWDPPWLSLNAFGGYGVMNTDGEWNDARQAQFAETHFEFGRVTEEQEHIDRAMAAARAAFTTIFSPVSASRYSGWWRLPEGMAAENHGHGGWDQLNGVSGFDWGTGSALATAAYFDRQKIRL